MAVRQADDSFFGMTLSKSQYRQALMLVLVVAYALRLYSVDRSPLWFDEALEYWVASTPIDRLAAAIREFLRDPPIYSVLLHFWMKVGQNEFVLRQITVAASLLTVVTVATLVRQVYSRAAAIFAAFLLSVLAPHLWSAHEVGQYALMGLSLALNLWAAVRVRASGTWTDWLAWTVTGLFAVYTYYGSLLVIGPVTASLFVGAGIRRKFEQMKRLSLASAVVALLTLPLLIFWMPSQFHWGGAGGRVAFSVNPLPVEFMAFLNGLKPVLAYQLTGTPPNPESHAALIPLAAVLFSLTLLFSLISLLRCREHAYIHFWLAGSWLLAYLAGRVGAYPFGPGRHVLILAPLLIVSSAIGLAFLWKLQRLLATLTLIAVVAVTFLAPRQPPEDLRTVVDYYLSRRDDRASTYVYYGAVPAFRYQMEVLGGTQQRTYGVWYQDCWAKLPSPACVEVGIHYGRWIRQLPAEEKYTEIMSSLGDAGSTEFWVIFSHTEDKERRELIDILEVRHKLVDRVEAEGASGYLFQSPSN